MIKFVKYGYNIILSGDVPPDVLSPFIMERFCILKKDKKYYFVKYNDNLIQDLLAMGVKFEDKQILQLIEPLHNRHQYRIKNITGVKKIFRNIKIEELLNEV